MMDSVGSCFPIFRRVMKTHVAARAAAREDVTPMMRLVSQTSSPPKRNAGRMIRGTPGLGLGFIVSYISKVFN